MNSELERILKYLPERIRQRIYDYCSSLPRLGTGVSEIRLRANAPASLTIDDKNICIFNGKNLYADENEIVSTLGKLCEDSIHTYAETIKEGYVYLSGGYRIGICGYARSEKDKVAGIHTVSSLCIRIPHAITGICDSLLQEIVQEGDVISMLVYSPPGVGKTTLLRDVAYRLSTGNGARRVCIIDTRGEIYINEMFVEALADVMTGYPKAKGMEIAARTLSPQVMICDEIGTDEEADAILSVQNCGVPLIASAHAGSFEELMRRPNINKLVQARIFKKIVGIKRVGGKFDFDIKEI
ncbi:MAG: AAA family ATPase [Clostridia bacterium]|nr:AAA family ATPase [Clostridia bacterium]